MKFFGIVGYGIPGESVNGVWSDNVTERQYYGDIVKDTRRIVVGSDVNPDITTSNSVEILADPYALEHFDAIKYVELGEGRFWSVSEIEQRRPRLLLRLGGVYNGPRPATIPDEGSETGTPDPSRRDSGR
jgi:hypothetical protein